MFEWRGPLELEVSVGKPFFGSGFDLPDAEYFDELLVDLVDLLVNILDLFLEESLLVSQLLQLPQAPHFELQDHVLVDIDLVPQDLIVRNLRVLDLYCSLRLIELILGVDLVPALPEGDHRWLFEEAVFDCFIFLKLAIVLVFLQCFLIALDFLLLHHIIVVAQHLILVLKLCLHSLLRSNHFLCFVVFPGQSFADHKFFAKLDGLIVVSGDWRMEIESLRVAGVPQGDPLPSVPHF